MNHKLKYLKLFEGLSTEEIPYSNIDKDGKLHIRIPKTIKSLPPEYNQLTDEITGYILIKNNPHINKITLFDNLTKVGWYLEIKSNASLTSITEFNSVISIGEDLEIKSNQSLTKITGFNNLKSIGWYLEIKSNESLTTITGFNSLEIVGWSFTIESNKSLTKITGFDNLKSVDGSLVIKHNPKLVTISIPGSLVKAVDYFNGYVIMYDNNLKFKSPGDFINSPVMYKDLVTKFNTGDHGDQVIKQIINNIEEWGTEETKQKVYSFLVKYLTPEHWELVPDKINHRYNPDYRGTTGRDVAKVNSGEIYGIF